MSRNEDEFQNASEVDVDALTTLQADRIEALKQIFRNFKKDSSTRKTRSYCQVRLEKLELVNKDFGETHKRIVCFDVERKLKYFTDEIASQFEESYFEIRCALLDTFGDQALQTTEASVSDQQRVVTKISPIEVPKLPLPSFSGNYTEWPAFYDAYVRLIHMNADLNAIQKFHFLKKALPTNSDLDVQNMALTETNYSTAWDLIVKRYDNPRLLFMHHMNKLFSLPALNKERSDDIKSLLNTANVCINEFKRLKIPISECDQWIAYFLSTKLPRDTHQAWEHHLGSNTGIPSFNAIESFLNNRLVTINVIENRNVAIDTHLSSKNNSTNNYVSSNPRNRNAGAITKKSFHVTAQPKIASTCCLCGDGHILRRCSNFLSKDCFERKSIVDKAKLCLNCLSGSHNVSQCTSAKNCLQCGQRHHTLLHFPSSRPYQQIDNAAPHGSSQTKFNQSTPPFHSESTPNRNFQQTPTTSMSTHTTQFLEANAMPHSPRTVLLATALVKLVNDVTGQTTVVRALLDQGSEGTIISEHAVQTLSLTRNRTMADISGVGSQAAHRCRYTVSFSMRSCVNPTFNATVDTAFVLNALTNQLPNQTIEPQCWPHIQGLQLADPTYYQSRRVDLLIGADMFAHILLPEIRLGRFDEPVAQNTHLGWVLSGNTAPVHKSEVRIHCHHSTLELESIVQKFYELEQVPNERSRTEEENWCETHFQQTHRRQQNGKYTVRLPLKNLFDDTQTIGKSKQIALNRFYCLERKLQRNEVLRTLYEECIQEYFHLNQITPATTTEAEHCVKMEAKKPTVTSCVLPHHAVLKEESLTTKLRIVFDASCKTTNGKSLNDILCVGPALQNDLSAVILNWRKHKFAFTADIQKMYRCIDMNLDDSQYQRILWRNAANEIKEYCLTTVTFGTASAPYTAIRVLHQLAEDEQASYPLAAPVLKTEIYVDDVLSGSHSIETASNIREQLTLALRSAGMELRKWSSNSSALLDGIPTEHMSDSNILELNSSSTVKTLGLCWQPNKDIFKFKLNFDIDFSASKRSMLSIIARLFDPLGFIAPVVVAAKIILKSVWSLKIQRDDQAYTGLGWDEILPSDLNQQWQQFLKALSTLHCITVPRWLHYEPTCVESLQLHAFCDGSSSAYAACVYLRVKCTDGRVNTTLLIAKSRVTPTKPLTIPRVELCGAVLATELIEWTKRSFLLPDVNLKVYFWTDATIVLYWINGDPTRWQTWVSNRIGKILRASAPPQWSHVDTLHNPADCATRGLTPAVLSTFKLWWAGPEWLLQPESGWPKFTTNKLQVNDEEAEVKIKQIHVNFTICQDSVILKYSSLNKTIRICAYIFRFAFNSRVQSQSRLIGPLTVTELRHSLAKIVTLVQQDAFPKEMQCVQNKKPLPTGSKLTNLTPFLDDQQILRVRGRIQLSNLPFDQKHPIILPSCHHFTSLVIANAHLMTLHGGTQLTISYLRQKFWIVNTRRAVKQQLRKCIKCFRNNPEVATQLMGNLPFHRVNPPQRPFLATGVDYTGAIEIKASKFRGNMTYKGYIAIFICLATKCIHLEAVTGMSTENFLWALQRFIGRRGICKDIYSDCGTNFIGAEKVLQVSQRLFSEAVKQEIVPKLTNQGIQWHFNPPHSPNFGGLWEANVKSVKHHLKRVIDGTRLTYEALSTVLVRIESCLNSRPLCPLTSDPEDLLVLTPGHFLVGDSLLSPPMESPAAAVSLSQQFIQTQRMLQQFWQQWTSDWLSHLQIRPKWCHQKPNLQLNDLVIVKDDRLPPNEWIMARVVELHPGQDNLVRVVTIRTKQGTYKRSISKLCPLPIPSYTQEN